MKKIANYVLNGQGFGLKFLMGLSVLMALIFAIILNVKGTAFIPYAQEIADQMLPVKVQNGVVVEPYNTVKTAHVSISEYVAPLRVPLVIDTRVDSLDATKLSQGIYLTRTKFYVINKDQIRMVPLEGDIELAKGDYTQDFKSWLNWASFFGGIIAVFSLFVLYLILSLFYSLCTQFIAWIGSKEMPFDRRMRLSSLALTVAYVIFIPLEMIGVHSTFLFFVLMIASIVFFVIKMAPAAPRKKTETLPVAEKTLKKETPLKTEEVKAVPAKKTSAAKPAAKKAPVSKVQAKKPGTKKPAVKKSASKK